MLRHPDDRLVERLWGDDFFVIDPAAVRRPEAFPVNVRLHVAVKAARLEQAHLGGRHPAALIVAHGQSAVGQDAHAVRRAEAGAVDGAFLAVGRNLDDRSGQGVRGVLPGLDVVEIAFRVALQVKIVRVKKGGHVGVGAEALVKIRLPVVVQVVQPREAILAGDVDFIVDHLQTKRLVQPGGEPSPLQLGQAGVDAGDDPHITAVGGHDHPAVREKRERRGAEPHVAGRVAWQGESVERVGGVRLAKRALGRGRAWPTRFAAGQALGQVRHRVLQLEQPHVAGEREQFRLRVAAVPDDLKPARLVAGRNGEHRPVFVVDAPRQPIGLAVDCCSGKMPKVAFLAGAQHDNPVGRTAGAAVQLRSGRVWIQESVLVLTRGELGHGKLERFFARADTDRMHDRPEPGGLGRALKNLSAIDRVREHHAVVVEIVAAILHPLGRHRAAREKFTRRVIELVDVCPAPCLQAGDQLAAGQRHALAALAEVLRLLEVEESTSPHAGLINRV